MAHIKAKDIPSLYEEAINESKIWRKDYQEFERLADNELIEDLDESLPEVNDGTLAASLFKAPKRIISTKLVGRAKATDRTDAWLTELANLQWENEILPNANTQAPFIKKWKVAIRKALQYGSVPLITIFADHNGKPGADFFVAQPQDVTLEPSKVSDYDSDVMFWDVYFSDIQMDELIDQAKEDIKDNKDLPDKAYNKWDLPVLREIRKAKIKEQRSAQDSARKSTNEGVIQSGYHFTITVQRGVNAPFYMNYKGREDPVREWTNPDPTGDPGIHFLYCYQDFINPYGIGIVKLAGGTQNVLDYFRQADVLATQLGFRPPVSIGGDTTDTDFDSIMYAQDQQWMIGNAKVQREEISNQIYAQLPGRIQMYKQSLNQLLPTGETSATAADTGDPQNSKTPAGVKLQAANLSIDDDDLKDNVYQTYEAVVQSMINVHFANMQGTDLMKLTDEERELLQQGGLDFPLGEDGKPANELEVEWDKARALFDFTIDADQDKTKDDEARLEGLLRVAEFRSTDPMFDQKLAASNYKIDDGELYSEIIGLTTDNDKILVKIAPEDQANQMGADGQPVPQTPDPNAQANQQSQDMHQLDIQGKQQKMQQSDEVHQVKMAKMTQPQGQPQQGMPQDPTYQANLQGIMETYGVDENIAMAALEAEAHGEKVEDIIPMMIKYQGAKNGQ